MNSKLAITSETRVSISLLIAAATLLFAFHCYTMSGINTRLGSLRDKLDTISKQTTKLLSESDHHWTQLQQQQFAAELQRRNPTLHLPDPHS